MVILKDMKKKLLILIPICILEFLSIYYLKDSYQLKQLIWFILGLISFTFILKLKEKHLKVLSIFLYILSIILLIVVLFHPYTNGSRGWLKLYKISIQPSEITKLSLILITYYLVNEGLKSKLIFLSIYLIPSILTFIEPDTGACLIYGIIFLYFLPKFFKKKEIILLFSIGLVILMSLIYLYIYKKDLFIDIFSTSIYYRLDRITSFKEQSSMQVNNALISIGSGKLLYFPEANNDFFLAYLVSKNYYNFFIIILCYFLILLKLLILKMPLSTLVFYLILFPVIENIGMNLSLLPVIGIPLPYLSYGGSHTIISFMILGLGLKRLSNTHNMN